jgi:4-hydroxybenzoate polyprenyltransferase
MCSRAAPEPATLLSAAGVRDQLVAWLELVRVPNLFTAIADVLAGYLYATRGDLIRHGLPVLCAASLCLYAGGVTLNDVFDMEQDRAERPARPLPSGRVSRGSAAGLAALLLSAGIVLAGSSSGRAAVIAALLALCIVLYDGVLKRTPVGPVLMGACRGLNLLLGMSVSLGPATAVALVPAGLLGAYVASLTRFASREARSQTRGQLLPGALGVLSSVAGLAGLMGVVHEPDGFYLIGVAALFSIAAVTTARGIRDLSPLATQRAVRTLLVMLVGLDACIAWSAAGITAALSVASLIVPTALLGRFFRMT